MSETGTRGATGKPEKARYCFTFRYERAMEEALQKLADMQGNTVPALIRNALRAFEKEYSCGRCSLAAMSDFRRREDQQDKREVQVQLPASLKILLARLAFVHNLSQAELLRMALEWYVRGFCLGEENYYQKNHYSYSRNFVVSVFYDLYSTNCEAISSSHAWNPVFRL